LKIEFFYRGVIRGMWVFALKYAMDGEWLLSSTSTGQLTCWNLHDAVKLVSELENNDNNKHCVSAVQVQAHSNPIYTMAVLKDIVVTGSDEEIRVWREPWNSMKSHAEFKIPQIEGSRGSLSALAETNGVSISHNGTILTAAAGDGNAYYWDIETQKLIGKLTGHTDYLHAVATYGDNLVATGSEDGTCKLWDSRTDECICTFEGGDIVSAVAFSPDGNWLAIGGAENRLGSITMGHVGSKVVTRRNARANSGRVQSLTYSGDNLVLGGDGSVVEFWSRTAETHFVDIPTSNSTLFAIEYDSTGGLIASAGSSRIIDVFSADRSHIMSLSV